MLSENPVANVYRERECKHNVTQTSWDFPNLKADI